MSEPADNLMKAQPVESQADAGSADAAAWSGELRSHMRPSGFSFGAAELPVRHAFRDLVGKRARQHSIVVYVEDADGVVGVGEGVACEQTGETLTSALSFLHRRRHMLSALANPEQLAAWCTRNALDINLNPGAYCAAELALVDLYAKQARHSLETMFAAPPSSGELRATALLGGKSGYRFRLQQAIYGKLGMNDVRLRLTGKPAIDLKRAATLVKSGRVYVDAHGLWPDVDSAVAALSHLKPHIWGVVDPVGPRDWGGMEMVSARTGISVIADAGVTGTLDLTAMPRDATVIPVISVSKMGGLMRAVSSLRTAMDQDRKVIVGATPGESSILGRTGAMLGLGAGDRLVAFEGALGLTLVERDLVDPPISVGQGGKVRVGAPMNLPGLGVALRADARKLLNAPQNADYWMPSAEPN